LGVRRIRKFNLSLIGKWCWRLREEKGFLWYRVLVARYGEEGGTIGDEGRLDLVWWNNLSSIRKGDGKWVESWFNNHLRLEVGDVVETLFWWDP